MPNVVEISPFRSFHTAAQQSIPSIPGGHSQSLGHNPAANCFAQQVLQAGDPLLSKRAVEVSLDAIGSCAIERVIKIWLRHEEFGSVGPVSSSNQSRAPAGSDPSGDIAAELSERTNGNCHLESLPSHSFDQQSDCSEQ
ncbi:hypothetical protein SELMODRAFT_419104 [Selaginella moellendorffii]|uniref:Uncharacterized protein n=1 Tax=Selaginella moellendorffii TaxID=88036 RepID=D8S7V1_SELML|nr:hypothetical protein SELMODRAFT_419104 [Selaginella moellendorffii]